MTRSCARSHLRRQLQSRALSRRRAGVPRQRIATWNMDPACSNTPLAECAAITGCRARSLSCTCSDNAPTWIPSLPFAAVRSPGARGCGRGPGRQLCGDGPRAPWATSASSPSTATKSSPPPAAACSFPANACRSKGALLVSPGPRSGYRLRTLRAGLQLPHEQCARRHWPRPARSLDLRSTSGAPSRSATATPLPIFRESRLMPQAPYGLHTNWLSCFLIDEPDFGCSRDALIRALRCQRTSEARPVWKPMHLQPLYRVRRYGGAVAEDLFRAGSACQVRAVCRPKISCTSSIASDGQPTWLNWLS